MGLGFSVEEDAWLVTDPFQGNIFRQNADGTLVETLSIDGLAHAFGLLVLGHTPAVAYLHTLMASGIEGDASEPSLAPQGDGVPYLIKYAFNMDLAGPDSSVMEAGSGTSELPATELLGSGSSAVYRMEFLRRVGSGLIYHT